MGKKTCWFLCLLVFITSNPFFLFFSATFVPYLSVDWMDGMKWTLSCFLETLLFQYFLWIGICVS